MPLNLLKLENVQKRGDGKVVARCPACAAEGKDNVGNHLVAYPDGRFGCVANPQDKEHRQQIYRLVGASSGVSHQPKAIEIRPKNACQEVPFPNKQGFGRFGRVFSFSRYRRNNLLYKQEVEKCRPKGPDEEPTVLSPIVPAPTPPAAAATEGQSTKRKKKQPSFMETWLGCPEEELIAMVRAQKVNTTSSVSNSGTKGASACGGNSIQTSAKGIIQ